MDVDRAEQEDFGWGPGGHCLRDRFSASNGGDLIRAEPDVLPEKCVETGTRLRIGGKGRRDHQDQHNRRRVNTSGYRAARHENLPRTS